jgi:hypothetical protein
MGTEVQITVKGSQYIEIEEFYSSKPTRVSGNDDLVTITFMDSIPLACLNKLTNHSIAFTAYANGVKRHVRYTPRGRRIDFTVKDGEENPKLEVLMLMTPNPGELAKYIRDYHANNVPLPWDNQEEYGKIHRTLELIK